VLDTIAAVTIDCVWLASSTAPTAGGVRASSLRVDLPVCWTVALAGFVLRFAGAGPANLGVLVPVRLGTLATARFERSATHGRGNGVLTSTVTQLGSRGRSRFVPSDAVFAVLMRFAVSFGALPAAGVVKVTLLGPSWGH